jgi:O-antigen/teichoic acid export membrane protein
VNRAAGSLAIKGLAALYGASLVLFVIRVLPAEEYGKYGIAFALVNVVGSIWRGLWLFPLTTWAARAKGEEVIGPALWLTIATAILGGAAAIVILPHLGVGGNLPILAACVLLLFVPHDVAMVLAQAKGQIWLNFLMDGIFYIGSLVGFATLAMQSRLATAEMTLFINLAAIGGSAVASIAFYPVIIRTGFRGCWMDIIRFGRWSGIMSAGDIWVQQGDAILAGAFLDPVRIAPYLAARTLVRMYSLLSQSVNFILMPVAARLSATGRMDFLRRRMRLALLLIWAALIPLNIAIWFSCDWLFPIFLSAKYVSAIPLFKALVIISLLEPMYSITANAMLGIGKPKEAAKLTSVSVIFSLTGNLVLLPLIGVWALPIVVVATHVLLAAGSLRLTRREIVSMV